MTDSRMENVFGLAAIYPRRGCTTQPLAEWRLIICVSRLADDMQAVKGVMRFRVFTRALKLPCSPTSQQVLR